MMERIEWIDSGLSFASTWMAESLIEERAREWDGLCVSVGHVVYEDDERVILGTTHDPEGNNWAACFGIQKRCIVKRVPLSQLPEQT